MVPLAIFLGGGAGAVSRYGLTLLGRSVSPVFPLGTLTVNLLGCFVLGLLGELTVSRLELSRPLQAGLTTGFLGGLTTFSTFGYESVRLGAEQGTGWLVVNVAANVLVGLGLAALGVYVGGRLS